MGSQLRAIPKLIPHSQIECVPELHLIVLTETHTLFGEPIEMKKAKLHLFFQMVKREKPLLISFGIQVASYVERI